MSRASLLPVLPVAFALTACTPIFAPPLRGSFSGAPARLEADRMEIGGAVAGPSGIMVTGGPHFAIGLRDWVSLETGTNLYLPNALGWAMQFVGARFSFAPDRARPVHLIADLELGAGAGVGGMCGGRCNASVPAAGGGYQGLGLGFQARWFSLYFRGRVEETVAQGIPFTMWYFAVLGIEFNVKRAFYIGLAGGAGGYNNSAQNEGPMPVTQIHLGFDFDLHPGRARPDAEPASDAEPAPDTKPGKGEH